MNELDEVIQEFLVESYENLDRLDNDLVALERDPSATELISSVFRTIHTIKGTCGFLGFSQLESVTHAGENLLSRLRDGRLDLDAEIASALLAMGDTVRQMLTRIEATGEEGDFDTADLVNVLTRLTEGDRSAPAAPEAPAPEAPAPETPSAEAEAAKPKRARTSRAKAAKVAADAAADAAAVAAEAAVAAVEVPAPEAAAAPPAAVTTPAAPATETPAKSEAKNADVALRVDVGLLDTLMRLVGELVLTRNQILQYAGGDDPVLSAMSQRLNLITTELQEGVMKTRMQPIGNVWNKLPRVVRDLSLAVGKQVRLEMEGEDTELDKTIIEAIRDPLTHLVRNAVDHGIEGPEERSAAGKAAAGVLSLRAFHEGGQVNIEIADDGGGIDADRVKAKGVERGLIGADQAARMSDREAFDLIFMPGFSTREQVTNLSGRGVGMDVVKTNIEKIGGSVEISSKRGRGTTFKVKIPLTLAIIPALLVQTAGDRYAIPQVNLVELVRLEGEQAAAGVEMISGAPVHRLRGRLLPLVYLNRELSVGDPPEPGQAVNIVVLAADDQQFGLVVDSILDTEEIVVKPLGKQVKHVSAFAGATIMGDGRVALILDVLGIAQRSGVIAEIARQGLADLSSGPAGRRDEHTALLVLGLGDARVAIPLVTVARLEELPAATVERAGSQEVVQYRERLLPLLRLGDLLGYPSDAMADPLQVVVHTDGVRQVGLVVDRILDIVEESLDTGSGATRPGITGSVVISGHVTDLLDVGAVTGSVDPSFFDHDGSGQERLPEEVGQ
jgi:two-component system chemotaxis sensor kinase CheA